MRVQIDVGEYPDMGGILSVLLKAVAAIGLWTLRLTAILIGFVGMLMFLGLSYNEYGRDPYEHAIMERMATTEMQDLRWDVSDIANDLLGGLTPHEAGKLLAEEEFGNNAGEVQAMTPGGKKCMRKVLNAWPVVSKEVQLCVEIDPDNRVHVMSAHAYQVMP